MSKSDDPGKELLGALNRMIQDSRGGAGGEARQAGPSVAGGLFLVLFAFNVACIVNQIWPAGSRLFDLLAKIVPFVLGTAAVAYVDAIRGFLVRIADLKSFRWANACVFIGVVAVVLIAKFPAVQIPATLDPPGLLVSGIAKDKIWTRGGTAGKASIEVHGIRLRSVIVTDQATKGDFSDTVHIGIAPQLRTWLRSWPGLGSVEQANLKLSTLYPVHIIPGDNGTLEISGSTTALGFASLQSSLGATGTPDSWAIEIRGLRKNNRTTVRLPPGKWDRVVFRGTRCVRTDSIQVSPAAVDSAIPLLDLGKVECGAV